MTRPPEVRPWFDREPTESIGPIGRAIEPIAAGLVDGPAEILPVRQRLHQAVGSGLTRS